MPTEPEPAGRGVVIEHILRRLRTERAALTITGDAGVGRTTVAGAVATRLALPIVAARLAGARTAADVVLAIGWACAALMPGAQDDTGAALRERGRCLVVLDDADVPGASAAYESLSALAPDALWLCTGDRQALPGQEVRLDPLTEGSGNPLLDQLGEPDPWSVLEGLGEEAEALSLLPAGLPGATTLPRELLLPMEPGRSALRRAAAQAMLTRRNMEPSRVASSLARRYEALLAIATGAPLPDRACPADVLALRWIGEVVADPETACRASASASRLMVAWGQGTAARAVLTAAERRNQRAEPGLLAVLTWARADGLLATGALSEAMDRFDEAATQLRQVGDRAGAATLMRRQADALAARGEGIHAALCYRGARKLHRELSDQPGVSATLRGAADVAVGTGELLSAGALYDQAAAAPTRPIEQANRQLGEATLAMASGQLGQARAALDSLSSDQPPLLQANALRRQAELYLRTNELVRADSLAEQAAGLYARVGEHVALGRAIRLWADVAALAGHPTRAAGLYERAIALQVRVNDVPGLARTLSHAAELEAELGDRLLARQLRSMAAQLES